jgi:hypothetical protein
MKFNHYIIGSLPTLKWDEKSPYTMDEFINHSDFLLEPYRDGVDKILLLNEIRNIELFLKAKIKKALIENDTDGNSSVENNYFKPFILSESELSQFLEHPFFYQADEYPEFMLDYFEKYAELEDRYNNIEELYIRLFTYLREQDDEFFKYYGNMFTIIRTVLAAFRIIKEGKDLESNLVGDHDIVQIILDHRTTSDLGLKAIFPEIPEIISLFDKDPLELEKDLDRIQFELLEDYRQDQIFGDHVIYCYLLELFILDKWHTVDKARGQEILANIING